MGTRSLMGLALLLLGGLGAQFAVAADLSVVPAVEMRGEYDSNLNFVTSGPRVKDYIFTLAPSAEFNYATEAGQLQGRLGLTGMHYLNNPQIDHVDQNYQINGNYAATSRLSFLIKTAYIVDSTMQQELSTSGSIIGRTPRQSILANPGFSYAVTERLLATVTYNFNQVHYEEAGYQSYNSNQVNLRFDYAFRNQKTTLISNVVAGQTVYSASNSFRSLGTYLGLNRKFSERWEATLMAGLNFTQLEFATQALDFSQFPFFRLVQTTPQKESAVTPYVSLFTTRYWARASITGGYSRDQSPSAYGGVSQVNRINLYFKYDFTERLVGNLYADYYRTDNTSEQSNIKDQVYQISPQVTYRLTEQLSLTPAYRFGYRQDLASGTSGNRHNVWLFLTYSYPIHRRW